MLYFVLQLVHHFVLFPRICILKKKGVNNKASSMELNLKHKHKCRKGKPCNMDDFNLHVTT